MKIIDLILKYKTALIAVTLVLTVAVAAVLYNSLSDKFGGGVNELPSDSGAGSQSGGTEEKPDSSGGSDEKPNTDGGEEAPDTGEVDHGDEDHDHGDEEGESKAPTVYDLDFTALDSNGNTVKLSDYVGKPIVLNFWATWCVYCKQEMPDFDKAAKELTDVTFLMVNATTTYDETVDAAKKYVEQNGFEFPVLYDTKGEAINSFGVSGFPTTFFIDEGGTVRLYVSGAIGYETILSALERMANE